MPGCFGAHFAQFYFILIQVIQVFDIAKTKLILNNK